MTRLVIIGSDSDVRPGVRCHHVRGGEVAKMAAGASTVPRTVLQPVMSQSSTVLYCNAVSLGSTQILWLSKKVKDIFYQDYASFLLSHSLKTYFPMFTNFSDTLLLVELLLFST